MTKQGDTTVLSEPYMYVSPATGVTSTQVYRYRTTTATGNSTWYYSYDQNGNITYVDSSAFGDVSYQYDSQGQLLWEYSNVTYYATQWEYDDAGNILSRKVYDYYFDEIDSLYRSDTYSYTDTQWGDLLTGYNGRTITYDGIGNPVNDGIWTYAWQHGRQLASMTSGSTTWTYTYNADGLRTKKTDGTNTYTYIYNGSKLTAMTKGSNTLYFTYDASGTPLAVNYNNATYYYTVNLQGDILGIVDNSGNTVATYAYDAWGNLLSVSGSMASTLGIVNPLRYRGYVYDTETKLYYLQSRYYNPEWGRFINADGFVTTGQGFVGNNMFAYCGNNPVNRVDPTGAFFESILVVLYEKLKTATNLLLKWIFGDGSTQLYTASSRLSIQLKTSPSMIEAQTTAYEQYKSKQKTSLIGSTYFSNSKDGTDLYLAVRRAEYSIDFTAETHISIDYFGIMQIEAQKYDFFVIVNDDYDFTLHQWDSVGNVLNNCAYYAHQAGIGKDYEWYAFYKTSYYEGQFSDGTKFSFWQ